MSGKLAPDEPCGTPGAVYETRLQPDCITLRVYMKGDLRKLLRLTPDEKQELIGRFHQAILAPMEWLFEVGWANLAGRPDEDGKPYPLTYHDLFSNWRPPT